MSRKLPTDAVIGLHHMHGERRAWLESVDGPMVGLATEYPDGYEVPEHRHSRSQLLHALSGVVLVKTRYGRWIVPPDHAMWIPAGVDHSVDMLGQVSMRSVYVAPKAIDGLPSRLKVVGVSPLVRSLIIEAMSIRSDSESRRDILVRDLLLQEIPAMPEQPLGLAFPAEARLAALCRAFVAHPTARATIDDWADMLGMSRRTFTRAFQRETGLSLSVWRQQALLFAALPRLTEGEAVTTVAIDLGYDSVPAFTTMFRRMLGRSPRDYVRNALVPA